MPNHSGDAGHDGVIARQDPLTVFRIGQVLDNTYRIVRLIGEGGMGIVYEATHARLAGRYAIKVLLQRLSDNPEAMARFDREARITSSLQHPNIVQVLDFNTAPDGTDYLVMEYLQGETLAERLYRTGALPQDVVAGIVEQIAAGLTAAHSHGVVHRDLKPDNVFLLPVEGRRVELAKVLDFGISKISDKISDSGHRIQDSETALMGTPQYMSPEQCQGPAADVDAATDQFALAAISYEMLTGWTPFPGDTVGAVLSNVLYDNPRMLGIDPDVEQVVSRGLAKSKHDRFPSVAAFAEALRITLDRFNSASHSLTIALPTGDQVQRLGPPKRRPRTRLRAISVAVATACVTLSFGGGDHGSARMTSTSRRPASATTVPEVSRFARVDSIALPVAPSTGPTKAAAGDALHADMDVVQAGLPPDGLAPDNSPGAAVPVGSFTMHPHRTAAADRAGSRHTVPSVTPSAGAPRTVGPVPGTAPQESSTLIPSRDDDEDSTLPLDDAAH